MLETQYQNWKYLQEGTVKHIFYDMSRIDSICGVEVLPVFAHEWKSDKEGLRKKRPCKRCIDIRDS